MDATETGLVEDQAATPEGDLDLFGQEVAPQADTTPDSGSVLDLDLHGDYLVPLKVGGEERLVPLREAAQSAMMQSDYTRKTQELAAEREQLGYAAQLLGALEANPQATLRALQEAYMGDVADDGEPEDLDPEEQRWQQVERFMQEQRQREMQNEITTTINGLKSQFGEFDETGLLKFAVERNIPDLEVAYKALAFEQQRTSAQQQQAAVQGRKAALPPIAPGRGVQAGAVTVGVPDGPMSFEDALALSEQQLGRTV